MARERVELSWPEMLTACMVGVMRRLSSMKNGRITNRRFSEKGDFQIDIEGAIGEACFAKIRNLYWSVGVNTFKLPDVGEWQVRATDNPTGHLIVRPADDKDAVALVLLDGFCGTLVGWMPIPDAKQTPYWKEDKNGWWVPQSDLTEF